MNAGGISEISPPTGFAVCTGGSVNRSPDYATSRDLQEPIGKRHGVTQHLRDDTDRRRCARRSCHASRAVCGVFVELEEISSEVQVIVIRK